MAEAWWVKRSGVGGEIGKASLARLLDIKGQGENFMHWWSRICTLTLFQNLCLLIITYCLSYSINLRNGIFSTISVNNDAISLFSSVAQLCSTLCDPMDCSTPGFPVHHKLPEPAQAHVHRAGDAIEPSYPLSSPSPPAFNLSQHQGLFQGVSSLHQVAKELELQLQHQSFQWVFRVDFL